MPTSLPIFGQARQFGGEPENADENQGSVPAENVFQRGAKNPRVVDLIEYSPADDVLYIHILEDRPWVEEREMLLQLEEKINNYLDYVLDGHLGRDYPQYSSVPVCVLFCFRCNPTGLASEMLKAVQDFLNSVGLGFKVLIDPELSLCREEEKVDCYKGRKP